MRIFLFLTVFGFLFLACKKQDVADVDPNYIGAWTGQDSSFFYSIELNNNGLGEYQKAAGEFNEFEIGKATIRNGKIKIGKKKLIINQTPLKKQDDFGNDLYEMRLSEIIYIRFL